MGTIESKNVKLSHINQGKIVRMKKVIFVALCVLGISFASYADETKEYRLSDIKECEEAGLMCDVENLPITGIVRNYS